MCLVTGMRSASLSNLLIGVLALLSGLTQAYAITVSPQTLAFQSVEGQLIASPDTLTILDSPNCKTISIRVITNPPAWLEVFPVQGDLPSIVKVRLNVAGLADGSYSGILNIAASPCAESVNVMVSLKVSSILPVIKSVVNAASFTPEFSPGTIITIFGQDFTRSPYLMLPTSGASADVLGSTSVLINGLPGRMLFASDQQINVVIPLLDRLQSASVRVARGGRLSAETTIPIRPASPALFVADGMRQVAALNQGGTVNSPDRPAMPGEVISIFGTGSGLYTLPLIAGDATETAEPLPRIAMPVNVSAGGQPVEVLYAGIAPGLIAGAFQINMRVPRGAPTGRSVPVGLSIGDAIAPVNVISVMPNGREAIISVSVTSGPAPGILTNEIKLNLAESNGVAVKVVNIFRNRQDVTGTIRFPIAVNTPGGVIIGSGSAPFTLAANGKVSSDPIYVGPGTTDLWECATVDSNGNMGLYGVRYTTPPLPR